MPYTSFNPTYPDGTRTGPQTVSDIKSNLLAMRDACIMGGGFFGWAMAATGGTTAEPQYLTYSKGTERVRVTLTWDAGNVTQALYEYSSTSGSSYDTIGTKNITYSSGYVTGTTWS